jgi:hypothetical protein
MYIAVHRSKDALFALSFFLVMALVIFSTLIYFVERGVWDSNLGTFVTADGEHDDLNNQVERVQMLTCKMICDLARRPIRFRIDPLGCLVRACQ